MEKRILGQLGWYLTVATPNVFLVRSIKAAVFDAQANVTVLNSCDVTSMETCPFWNDRMKLHTGFSGSQLLGCPKFLVSCHMEAPDHKLKVVYKKYPNSHRGAVALNPSAISCWLFMNKGA
ncbi:Cyclin-B1-1 [Datura stramonium]|uniref:Cyclin-B1-1 n=1 Tax=Datura stramonium TaxID=4076 RepID=A0ABS8SLW4_DATST|nr:Cyclin-B1-1 [Datura stramonium]